MTDSTAIAHVRNIFDDDRMTSQLTTMLEGTPVTVAKFKSVAMTAIISDPDLLAADQTSLLTACVVCARAGLLPDKKEAALVVRNSKKKVLDAKTGARKEIWIDQVTFMPMVRGLYKLANGSGNVRRIRAHLVHAGDEFRYSYGVVPVCEHRPALGGKQGLPTHAYAIAVLTDGTIDLEVMTIAEVNEVRRWSKMPKGSAWGAADMPHGEMAKKTVLHRICKRLDLSPDARAAVNTVEAEYDFDAAADSVPRLDRPTAADDGLSMYDDMVSDPKAPELAPPVDVPIGDEDAAWKERSARAATERKDK